jgi:branched-chain amino acid transport system substrate-binding protein
MGILGRSVVPRGLAARNRRFKLIVPTVVAATSAVLLAACGPGGSNGGSPSGAGGGAASGGGNSAPGVTSNSITIGLLMSFTGPIADEFGDIKTGFDARIAMQNAKGGVYGRQIKIVEADDQSSATAVLTAAQDLVQQKNVFAVGEGSPEMFAAYKYLKAQGVPVVGQDIDGGPEWTPANPNLFAVTGSQSSTPPAAKAWGVFLKSQGVSTLGAIANTYPSAVNIIQNFATSAKAAGLNAPYVNVTIPATQVSNFGGVVQSMQQARVDGVDTGWGVQQGYGLLQDAMSAGFRQKVKVWIMAANPSYPELKNAQAHQLAQNTWAVSPVVPPQANTPAAKAFNAAVAKYAGVNYPLTAEGVEGWIAASAIVQGLQLAGKNPTREAFMTKLRAVNDFTGDGMEIDPVSFTKSNGTTAADAGPAPQSCVWFLQYKGDGYVAQPKPICDGLVGS